MKTKDYMKAVKKADREAELEMEHGWKSRNRIHKSKKQYDRKNKSRKMRDIYDDRNY